MAPIVREHDALAIVDAVTSFGGHKLDVGGMEHRRLLQLHAEMPGRAVRAGACRVRPAGARAPRASAAASISICSCSRTTGFSASITTRCRRRSSTPWTKRWRSSRKKASRRAGPATRETIASLLDGLKPLGLTVLPPAGERLWTLNAVVVPGGNVDEAAIRKHLMQEFNIEIGAGLGPLAGKIWRVGLMGASSSGRLIVLLLGALKRALAEQGHRVHGVKRAGRWLSGAIAIGFGCLAYSYLTLPDVRPLATTNPETTAFMEIRDQEARDAGKEPKRMHKWVSYNRISPHLKRAVLVAEDAAFWDHDGVDYVELQKSIEARLGARPADARRQHDHPAAREEPVPLAVEESAAQAARAGHRAPARGGAEEGADSRAVPEPDRVGRRHLRDRGRRARVFRDLGRGARADRVGAARRRDHQSEGAEPVASHRASRCAASRSSWDAWAGSSRRADERSAEPYDSNESCVDDPAASGSRCSPIRSRRAAA